MSSAMINRVVRIISHLSAGNVVTLRELKELVESRGSDVKDVSIRQYQRDIQAIDAAGVPIIFNEKTGKYSLKRSARLIMPPDSEQNQLLARYVIKSALPALKGSVAIDSITEMSKLLEEEVDGEVLPNPNLLESINLGMFTRPADDVILANAISVITKKQYVRLEYRGKLNKNPKLPCRLVPYNGRLYMIIWDPKYDDYSVYALDLVTRIMRLREQESMPEHDFSLDKFMKTRFGLWEDPERKTHHVVLRIVKPDLIYLFRNKYWHYTESFSTDKDGALLISFKSGLSLELISLVLHWAPDIEVVKPTKLKEEVVKKAKELLSSYGVAE